MKAIVFDVYGTLIDLASITTELTGKVDNPKLFFETWRNKQLEYSFRRGLMGAYKDFSEITRDALLFSNNILNEKLTEENIHSLLSIMSNAPTYDDVEHALMQLRQKACPLYAFSNGSKEKVTAILNNANLLEKLTNVISVDAVQSFKPDPNVYQHCCDSIGAPANECLLVSSNPFDIIGAKSFGMQTAWIKRTAASVFDVWEIEPDYQLSSLLELQYLFDKQA